MISCSLSETLQEHSKDYGQLKAFILATARFPCVRTYLSLTPSPALLRLSFRCVAVQCVAFVIDIPSALADNIPGALTSHILIAEDRHLSIVIPRRTWFLFGGQKRRGLLAFYFGFSTFAPSDADDKSVFFWPDRIQ